MSGARRCAELFGRRLRRLRRERKLTQRDVAVRARCSQSHVSTIEWGERTPNLVMILRLAVALECTVADLVCFFDRENLRTILPESDEPESAGRRHGSIS